MLNETLDRLVRRIECEFLEMPGLQLTLEQAQRLWTLDRETCVTALGELVDHAFLVREGDLRYRRVLDAPMTLPLRRAATRRTAGVAGRRAG